MNTDPDRLRAPMMAYESERGRVSAMRALLKAGADPTFALPFAIQSRRPRAVALLIAAGADVNTRGPWHEAPIVQATAAGSLRIVQMLLAAGASASGSAHGLGELVFRAIETRKPALLEAVLAAGARVDARDRRGQTALHAASQLHFGASDLPGQGLLMRPFREATVVRMMRALVKAGADVNSRGGFERTPLLDVPSIERMNVLIESGADLDARCDLGRSAIFWQPPKLIVRLLKAGAAIDPLDRRGWTPLMEWAGQGEVRCVEALLAGGANAKFVSECGTTPLHCAARRGCEEVVALLLRAGAEVHRRDRAGLTPLHLAASCGRSPAIKLLLDAGADPLVVDDHGRTPADWARPESAELLASAVARRAPQ